MKKFFQILLLLCTGSAFACSCAMPSFIDKYIKSDFVAKIKIIKNYKNESEELELYRADIEISEVYKGEVLESIFVLGRNDQYIGSSCAIFIPENTELIVYAFKDNDGKYKIGMCSGLVYLNTPFANDNNQELEMLAIFKSKNIVFTDKTYYQEKGNKLYYDLLQFKGVKLKKEYGFYEIVFSSELKIKNVTEISGLGNRVDRKLIEIIKKSEWNSYTKGLRDKVPEDSKLIIGIAYRPKVGEDVSYLRYF